VTGVPHARPAGLLTIGAFSRASGLTLKTLRLYDERGLVPPTCVDPASGYRYYDERALERARLVATLRQLEFPLAEIAEMLADLDGSIGLVPFLEAQRARIAERQRELAGVQRTLETMIAAERRALAAEEAVVQLHEAGAQLVAAVRFRGRYDECGRVIGRLFRHFGGLAAGPPLNLYHDLELQDEDADIESCLPLREPRHVPGFAVRTLPPARVARVVHRGAYAELGRSYSRLFRFVESQGLRSEPPIREIYHKGPGALFAGNPSNYRTELQVGVAPA
jgi:DNA-binding transcriptional MerR regulator